MRIGDMTLKDILKTCSFYRNTTALCRDCPLLYQYGPMCSDFICVLRSISENKVIPESFYNKEVEV